ncbi:MAG: DUF3343 domain-containing protein [Clostridiales bacterium]|nr:DUF3343 domain-containing protein [Clostridiales bacterium]
MDYLLTFFTHYAAMRAARALEESGTPFAMMPVPRAVSSNCGTCVRCTCDTPPLSLAGEDTEAIYAVEGAGYRLLYDNQ